MTIRRSIAAGAVLTAVLLLLISVATAGAASPRNFVAPLSGDEEFPLAIDTQARGVGIFQLSADGSELSYRLIATNINDVLQAHIHCCTGPMSNAGIAVWLYPSAPPPVLIPGRHTGVLATGTITADDIVGPALLTGADDPLAALVEQIKAGNAYVNVHTSANPGGEIRGQLP
jgi:hypothetical protein